MKKSYVYQFISPNSEHVRSKQRSPTFMASGTNFVEDNFPWTGAGVGDGFRMIQVHYIYCALYFYYYYISSTSENQALDPRGWGYRGSYIKGYSFGEHWETRFWGPGVRKAKQQRGLPESRSKEPKHLAVGTGNPDCNEVRTSLCERTGQRQCPLGPQTKYWANRGLVHRQDPEQSGGEEGGRGDRDGEYM